jgi:hypothetical protein
MKNIFQSKIYLILHATKKVFKLLLKPLSYYLGDSLIGHGPIEQIVRSLILMVT